MLFQDAPTAVLYPRPYVGWCLSSIFKHRSLFEIVIFLTCLAEIQPLFIFSGSLVRTTICGRFHTWETSAGRPRTDSPWGSPVSLTAGLTRGPWNLGGSSCPPAGVAFAQTVAGLQPLYIICSLWVRSVCWFHWGGKKSLQNGFCCPYCFFMVSRRREMLTHKLCLARSSGTFML